MGGFKTIKVDKDIPGVCWITLNRPEKYNAWNYQMYDEIVPTLQSANADASCKMVVLTGNGKYFTSGNDQNNFTNPSSADRFASFRDLIDLLIDMAKPMIALVNGPAVGMGVTMLPHFDLVIASDTATFYTPFTRLALCAEACSSYLFPKIMGYSRAAEMLMFNKKATVQEMLDWGLVSRIIPSDGFQANTRAIVKEFSQLNNDALAAGRQLIRSQSIRDHLHKVNRHEDQVLQELFAKPAALEAAMQFINRKAKL
ncbi:enoyl-CoA delta isomerase 2-like [Watersipora subatra]|uniref:enoyl-CoA delta isomerase 2-like n=1 Tax=Watersipora subatra TaxID=2589382 RepID=UPI00355B0273